MKAIRILGFLKPRKSYQKFQKAEIPNACSLQPYLIVFLRRDYRDGYLM